jgi:hypothetical protein
LRFFVPETTEHEVEYDNGFEFTKEKGKEAENQPINGFNVSVHYLIK